MDDDPSRKDDRVRILEFQVDQLRRELEHLQRRHAQAIYSVAWHLAWPARTIEAAIRRALAPRAVVGVAAPGAAPLSIEPAPARASKAAPRRLLIDVTAIVAHDDRTGIQRVVRNIVRALYGETDLGGVEPLAVRLQDGGLHSCEVFVAAETGVAQARAEGKVAIEPGDRLLMLDNSWKDFERFRGVFAAIRANDGEIVACLYDLIPQLYKGACVGDVPQIHLAWLKSALIESDAIIAISRTVAEQLCDFVASERLPVRPGLDVGWFHCGADIGAGGAKASTRMQAAFPAGAKTFLLVGTVEPRKGQAVALAAFDRLWRAGADLRLVFVGRRGWHVDAVVEDIRGHAEFGRRLYWFEDVDDGELTYAYEHCAAVVAPAYAEGFGLPLAEAAWRGKPAICSDIPVFREIGGDGALYFRVNDAQAMADAVLAFAEGRAKPDPSRMVRPTWREAARRIVEVIMRDKWMRTLP